LELSGCASGSSGPTAAQVQTVASDIAQVASVVAADVPAITQLTGVNAATITATANAVQSAAQAIAANGVSASGVQSLATDFNELLSAAEADPQLPAGIGADLSAAQLLITGAAAVYQLVAVSTPSPVVGAMAYPSPASLAAARKQLHARLAALPS
jgi:hypothetical protein